MIVERQTRQAIGVDGDAEIENLTLVKEKMLSAMRCKLFLKYRISIEINA
jgi:hypothetical protein